MKNEEKCYAVKFIDEESKENWATGLDGVGGAYYDDSTRLLMTRSKAVKVIRTGRDSEGFEGVEFKLVRVAGKSTKLSQAIAIVKEEIEQEKKCEAESRDDEDYVLALSAQERRGAFEYLLEQLENL